MTRGSPHRNCCSFCGRELDQVELLFRSEIGGLPPAICSECVDGFADVSKLYRADPAAADQAVAAHNAAIESARK